MSSRSFILAAQ